MNGALFRPHNIIIIPQQLLPSHFPHGDHPFWARLCSGTAPGSGGSPLGARSWRRGRFAAPGSPPAFPTRLLSTKIGRKKRNDHQGAGCLEQRNSLLLNKSQAASVAAPIPQSVLQGRTAQLPAPDGATSSTASSAGSLVSKILYCLLLGSSQAGENIILSKS